MDTRHSQVITRLFMSYLDQISFYLEKKKVLNHDNQTTFDSILESKRNWFDLGFPLPEFT